MRVLTLFSVSIVLQLSLGLGLVTPGGSLATVFFGALMGLGAFWIQGWLFRARSPLHPEFWRRENLWKRPKDAPTVLGGYPLEDTQAESQLESLATFYTAESLWIRGATLIYPVFCLVVILKLQLFPLTLSGFFTFGLPLALLIPAGVTPQFLIPVGLCAISTWTHLLSEPGFSLFRSPVVFLGALVFALTTFLVVRLASHLVKDQLHPSQDFVPRDFIPAKALPGFIAIAGICVGFGFIFSKIFPEAHPIQKANRHSLESKLFEQTASIQQELLKTASPPGGGGAQQEASSGSGGSGSDAAKQDSQTQPGSQSSRSESRFQPPTIPQETLQRGFILVLVLVLAVVVVQVVSRRKKNPTPKKPKTLSPSAQRELLRAIEEIEKRRLSPEQEIIQKYCAFLKAMETTENPWPKHLPTELYSERLSWSHGVIRSPLKTITSDHSDCYYGELAADPDRLERFRAQYREVVKRVLSE